MIAFLKNLPKTFYCQRFYRELIASGKGIGLGFLLVVTVLNVAQISALTYGPLNAFLEEQEPALTSMPSLMIKDGVISSDPAAPHTLSLLKEYEGGPLNFVIDTQADPMDTATLLQKMQDEKILIYIHKDGITFFDPSKNNLETKLASVMENQEITKENWQQVSTMLKTSFVPMLLLVVSIIVLIGHVMTACGGAVLLFIISPLFKVKTDFAAVFRLASAAKVPVAVIFLILTPQPMMQTLIWFGFAMFGLLAARKGAQDESLVP